jgi:hypothetical protein
MCLKKTKWIIISDDISVNSSQRVSPKKVDISKCVSERISLIHNMTKPRQVSWYISYT